MNIRKFEAKTFEEALNRVKTELGPDALILGSEERRHGWFAKPTVEITAAFEPAEAEKEWHDHELEKIFPHRRRISPSESTMEVESQRKAKNKKGLSAALSASPKAAAISTAEAAGVEDSLLELGLSPEVCRDFAHQITFEFPKKDRIDTQFLEKIKVKLVAAGVKTLSPEIFESRRAWAAVGAPGAGKTSLLVKLALGLKAHERGVILASSDNRKIVGRHELLAYAKIIGVPFHAGKIHEKKADQIILLDTPSVGLNHTDAFREVERNCRDASTVVVLDASQRLNELLKTVDRLSRLAPVALAFTRLDLVSQAGVVYDVLKQTKLPLLGLSVSPGFSSSFRFFEPATLARFIVRKPVEGVEQRAIIESAADHSPDSAI
jgi:flagellar biosynthesis protein FlhF